MSNIVVIEDDEVLADVLKRKLEQRGHTISMVDDGGQAIPEIRRVMPDLVLLDIYLPTENGLDILEKLNQDDELKKIPVIVISNSREEVEIKRIKELGAEDYLVKANFAPDELLEKVDRFLGEQSTKN